MTVDATGSATGPSAGAAHVVTPTHDADRTARIVTLVQRLAPFVVLALTVLIGALVFGSEFLNSQNLRIIAEGNAFLALIAIGMTFVIISGGIDLSVGSVLAVGAALTAYCSVHYGSVAAILVPLAVCGLIGLINGVLIARTRMAPFIVTLATLHFGRGFALHVADEGSNIPLVKADDPIRTLGSGSILGVPNPILFALVFALIAGLILNRTRSGQTVFAIGGSEDAATLMGLPIRRVKIRLYVATALLAGFAGMLTAMRSRSGDPLLAQGWELQAIAAVVIGGTLLTGGTGTISGTIAGVLLLGVINSLINQVGPPSLPEYWRTVVLGGFLIVVVVAQKLLSRRQQA